MPKTYNERKRSVKFLLGIEVEKRTGGVYAGLLEKHPNYTGDTKSEPKENYKRGKVDLWRIDDTDGTATNDSVVAIQVPGGVFRYWALFTAETGGEMIAFDALPWPLEVMAPETLQVQPGNLTILEA